MRIKEEFKRLGYFWLPSAQNLKVPGTLSISDGGFIELELVIPLDHRGIGLNDKHMTRIVGQVEEDGPVTLDDCSRKTSRIDFRGEIVNSILHVSRAFIGAAYGEAEHPRFNSVIFSVDIFPK